MTASRALTIRIATASLAALSACRSTPVAEPCPRCAARDAIAPEAAVTFHVEGAVQRAGWIAAPAGTTVFNGLLLASPRDDADLNSVVLIRKGKSRRIPIFDWIDHGTVSGNVDLHEGDLLRVPESNGNASASERHVGVGDSVTITDSFHAEPLVSAQVDVDGTVELPDLGSMYVLGMTRQKLKVALTDAYAPLYERTSIRVEIGGAHEAYFVVGEVQDPGRRAFEGDLTIFESILAAASRDESGRLPTLTPTAPERR